MVGNSKTPGLDEPTLEALVAQAAGDPRALATLAVLARSSGYSQRAYELARDARALAPDSGDVRTLTDPIVTAGVHNWHFNIVRDEARNAAYEAALKRAVGPQTRVLDIGTGTGLLALMAARAGAAEVITCEANVAIADAAADIVALNGFADRVRVIANHSTKLDPETDIGGPADLLVSEIVSNDMLGQSVLPVVEDAAARLLKPRATIIPANGRVRVALANWGGLRERRLDEIAGFDMSPFNRLDHVPFRLKIGDERLALRSRAADLFDFDFASGGPFTDRTAELDLLAEGGGANGVVQWIHLGVDAETPYENRPAPGAASCWACLFYPFEAEVASGATVRVHGAHSQTRLRIWAER